MGPHRMGDAATESRNETDRGMTEANDAGIKRWWKQKERPRSKKNNWNDNDDDKDDTGWREEASK